MRGARRRSLVLLVVLACLGSPAIVGQPASGASTSSDCLRPGVDDTCEDWVARHAPGRDDDLRPYDVAMSPDAAMVFVAGQIDTVAYDSDGNKRWTAAFPGIEDPNPPTAHSLAVSPDATRVYVTGQYQFPGDPYYATVAYDASTGARLWLALDGLPGNSGAGTHLGLSPDGATVYVTGENSTPCSDPTDPCVSRWGTIAYDASTGTKRWATYRPAGSDTPYDLAVSPDGGRIYVTGNLGDTVAYDSATGTEVWVARVPGDGEGDALWSLAVSPDGSRLFATGQTCQDDGGVPCNRYATVAFDTASGAVSWVARTPPGTQFFVSYPEAGSLAVSPVGDRVYVAGSRNTNGAEDGLLLGYDAATGALEWQAAYDAGSSEGWYDVAVRPDSAQVFVSGRAFAGAFSVARDFATAAYDAADGSLDWIARYNSEPDGNGIAVPVGGLAVSATGSRVVVAGTFGLDWGTVSYTTGIGHTTSRVSLASSGIQAKKDSDRPSVSADGRFTAFESAAANLVSGDDNQATDVFVRNASKRTTKLVSVAADGGPASRGGNEPDISADGRYVAFRSASADLVAGDTNGVDDVFVRDRVNRTTARVSVAGGGKQGKGASSAPAISSDGRYVVFASEAANLVAGDADGTVANLFVRDRLLATTTMVTTAGGRQVVPAPGERQLDISGDGRWVGFSSTQQLTPDDANNDLGLGPIADVFVHDLQAGQTVLASRSDNGLPGNGPSTRPTLSTDGQVVAFESAADTLVPGDSNGAVDVFVRDSVRSQTTRVSVSSLGAQGDGASGFPSISGNGRSVAFSSLASNLLGPGVGDANPASDVFVHDRGRPQTSLTSLSSAGVPANGASTWPAISGGGHHVVFASVGSNLVEGDTNARRDVFTRTR